ncbi:MAG: hypothetical protein K2W82_05295 [Candidatus Obscuribacterales bacterium]|nr:hypothetical protein [Candidatus Obscuribacterales bacterium]
MPANIGTDKEDAPLSGQESALELSRECAEIIMLIDEILFAFCQKRSTLEEKTISRYLHGLTANYARGIELIHRESLTGGFQAPTWQSQLSSLRTINEKVRSSVHELLKIIRYNLNFLEQYFEYDYAFNLTQNSRFVEDLESWLNKC